MLLEPDLLDKNIIQTILSEVENGEHKDRKREAFKAYQVYSGNVEPYVKDELSRCRPASWEKYTVSTISVSKMVVDKLAKSYDMRPKRMFSNDPNGIKTDRYQEIFDEALGDRLQREFDEIVNLHNYGLFWVNYNDMIQKYQFLSLAPYEFFVIRDKDTGILLTVGLKMADREVTAGSNFGSSTLSGDGQSDLIAEGQADSGGYSDVYAMWNSSQHVVIKYNVEEVQEKNGTSFKKDVTYVPIEGNPNNVNSIGVIPFVWVSKDNSVDLPTVNPITQQTITWNYQYSELLTSSNIQGTSIQTISYSESLVGKMDTITHGLTTAAELIQPDDPDKPRTEMDFVSPNPDLSGQMQICQDYLKKILSMHGISGSQAVGNESFSSGIERLIAQADTQHIISQLQQTLYTPMEKQIFTIIKAWESNILGKNVFKEDDTIDVIYEKPKVMITDKETLENIKLRLDLGLIEKWEALVMLDPNLDEKSAQEKLERIESEKNNNATRLINGLQKDESNETPLL